MCISSSADFPVLLNLSFTIFLIAQAHCFAAFLVFDEWYKYSLIAKHYNTAIIVLKATPVCSGYSYYHHMNVIVILDAKTPL